MICRGVLHTPLRHRKKTPNVNFLAQKTPQNGLFCRFVIRCFCAKKIGICQMLKIFNLIFADRVCFLCNFVAF